MEPVESNLLIPLSHVKDRVHSHHSPFSLVLGFFAKNPSLNKDWLLFLRQIKERYTRQNLPGPSMRACVSQKATEELEKCYANLHTDAATVQDSEFL